jgi:hypothetical protein
MAEVILDHLPPISKGKDKIPVPEVGIIFHDMPQDWPSPYIHHGFGTKLRLFPKTGACPAAKKDNFHDSQNLLNRCRIMGASYHDRRERAIFFPHRPPSGNIFKILDKSFLFEDMFENKISHLPAADDDFHGQEAGIPPDAVINRRIIGLEEIDNALFLRLVSGDGGTEEDLNEIPLQHPLAP